jgi:hypothetical protein
LSKRFSNLNLVLSDMLPHDVGNGGGDETEVQLNFNSAKQKF